MSHRYIFRIPQLSAIFLFYLFSFFTRSIKNVNKLQAPIKTYQKKELISFIDVTILCALASKFLPNILYCIIYLLHGWSIDWSTQGLAVALSVACNCRVLKVYARKSYKQPKQQVNLSLSKVVPSCCSYLRNENNSHAPRPYLISVIDACQYFQPIRENYHSFLPFLTKRRQKERKKGNNQTLRDWNKTILFSTI